MVIWYNLERYSCFGEHREIWVASFLCSLKHLLWYSLFGVLIHYAFFMSKKLLFWIGIVLFGVLQMTQAFSALPGWVSWVYQSLHYGVWSPSKASQNVLPDLLITQSGVVAVSPTNVATATSSDFQKGDIVAQRYCFEWSKECVGTFQQAFSNNQPYSVSLSDIIYADQDCTTKATDISKPFYICVNSATIATIGIDPSNATGSISNWFTLAISSQNAWGAYPKQLWIESAGKHFNNPVDLRVGLNDDVYDQFYTGSIGTNVFRACYVDTFDTAGNKISNSIFDSKLTDCTANTATRKVDYITYCDTSKNHCWSLRYQLRLTAGPSAAYYDYTQCLGIPYAGILQDWKTSTLDITSIVSTPFVSAPSSYTPAFCGNGSSMNSQIQIRFLMIDWSDLLPAQSLQSYVTDQDAEMYVKSLWVMYLK